jgi:putative heme-binding domain-containing protein
MYFITGGRGTQSGLYRVSYVGNEGRTSLANKDEASTRVRAVRHQLERFHGVSDSSAAAFAWPHLGSSDRFIRYAARVAMESQDVLFWQERARSETNVTAGLTALLALSRVGARESQPGLFKALARFPLDSLNEEQALLKLRVLELSLLRQGRPEVDLAHGATEELNRAYPAKSSAVNRELSRLLIYLEAPGVIPKTLDVLDRASTQEDQFHYIAQLRNVRRGWTPPQRERFFGWWLKPRDALQRAGDLQKYFTDVGRNYVDGAWADKYLREFRADAVATLTPEERQKLAPLLAKPFEKARAIPGSPRAFVREWTMADFLPELDRLSSGRNLARGRQAYVDAQCLTCHRFGNDGGSIGPELNSAGSKYDARALLESILEPSKVINEQYQNTTVVLKNGENIVGRLVNGTPDGVAHEVELFDGTREKIRRADVDTIRSSDLSPMPAGLLNILSSAEILDLLAYLQAGDRTNAPAFK